MGTDMWAGVEVCDNQHIWHLKARSDDDDTCVDDPLYFGRNYALFEILAGVRGFLHRAIKQPCGIPQDASPTYKAVAEGGYGHSWYTLQELLDFNWWRIAKTTTETLDVCTYRAWLARGGDQKPFTDIEYVPWALSIDSKYWHNGDVYRPKVPFKSFRIDRVLPRFMIDRFVKKQVMAFYKYRIGCCTCPDYYHNFYNTDLLQVHRKLPPLYRNAVCYVQSRKSYSKVADKFYNKTIPYLKTFGKPSNVRFVFFFD